MSPQPPYVVREWISKVAELKGDEWFLFNSLPDELRSKSLLLKADGCGLLGKKHARSNNDLKQWKVRL